MTKRQRMTWKKQAAAPPATPGYAEYFADDPHPAAQDDPDMHEYENGDTSSWAEDPHPGPYVNSEHPATPWEGSDHPANKKARTMRAAVERKAAKCVRIAQHMLGKKATPTQIEDQALDLMDLPDAQINTTLQRLGSEFMAQEKLLGQDDFMAQDEEKEGHDVFDVYDLDEDGLIAPEEWGGSEEVFDVMDQDGDGVLDVEEVGMGLGPEFSRLASGLQNEIKSLRQQVTGLKQAMLAQEQNDPTFMGMDELGDDDLMAMYADEDTEAEEMLAAMLAEEDEPEADDEAEAMLAAMLAQDEEASKHSEEEMMLEEMLAQDEEASKRGEEELLLEEMMAQEEEAAKHGDEEVLQGQEEEACNACGQMGQDDTELDIDLELAMEEDPMGLLEDITEDDSVLSQLYSNRMATKKSEDEDAEADEDSDDEADETSDNDDEDGDDGDEKDDKEAAKKKAAVTKQAASRKPRPRTASTSIKTVGSVQSAASNHEIQELSNLWASAPDVTEHFK